MKRDAFRGIVRDLRTGGISRREAIGEAGGARTLGDRHRDGAVRGRPGRRAGRGAGQARRERHAQAALLAGAHDPEPAPRAGHQGLSCGAHRQRGADVGGFRRELHAGARGERAVPGQRAGGGGRQVRRLQAQAEHQVGGRPRVHVRRRRVHLPVRGEQADRRHHVRQLRERREGRAARSADGEDHVQGADPGVVPAVRRRERDDPAAARARPVHRQQRAQRARSTCCRSAPGPTRWTASGPATSWSTRSTRTTAIPTSRRSIRSR